MKMIKNEVKRMHLRKKKLGAIIFWLICTLTWTLFLQLFALLGFIVSALWINTVASEVVNVLHLLGIILHLSNTVLGLTLLAWGNSIGGTQWYNVTSQL